MRVGATVDVFNAQGDEWRATITEANKHQVSIELVEPVIRQTESPIHTTILQAVSRGDRMDYTVQKATELGMHAFMPVLTERVGVKLDAKRWAKKVQHWQGVAISACEQSGRQHVPIMHQPATLADALQALASRDNMSFNHSRIMLEIGATNSLTAHLSSSAYEPQALALLVGPEGDFTDREMALAKQHGFAGVHIGRRVLRTETVAPTVLAVVQSLIGDWQ